MEGSGEVHTRNSKNKNNLNIEMRCNNIPSINSYKVVMMAAAILLFFISCSRQEKKYTIGVSQCSEDIWREKQNDELRMACYFHEDVDLRFAVAHDSDARQVQQIDSLVSIGIDLLIVAPNQVATISPAIDRAFDSGIPVIVFERKTNSQKYTAFMGADNYEMGRIMGEYMAGQLKGHGRVLEMMGLKGSSPAIERHKGFVDALKKHPDIQIVATLQGDWTEQSAHKAVMAYEGNLADLDFVFGQNDRMAIGVRKALAEKKQLSEHMLFCGIDGLAGEDGGIRLVRDSVLNATYIYPTRGDRLLELAMNILEGKGYEKENKLMSALVTNENANVLLMQNEEIERQSDYLDQLHAKADGLLQQLDTQRLINLLSFGFIAVLLLSIVLFYLYHQGKITLRRERVVNNLWNMDAASPIATENTNTQTTKRPNDQSPKQPISHEGMEDSSPLSSQFPTSPSGAPHSSPTNRRGDATFIARFKEVVQQRLSDSDLSVEDISASLHLSRVQLYRKVKALTGCTPVDLLRKARLSEAYRLLLDSDLSVSEIAYKVGFTSPSYFTKCFKDEYGKVPGEARQE